jgi:uncharacterized membrane protein YdcZ (DUF606 family)
MKNYIVKLPQKNDSQKYVGVFGATYVLSHAYQFPELSKAMRVARLLTGSSIVPIVNVGLEIFEVVGLNVLIIHRRETTGIALREPVRS